MLRCTFELLNRNKEASPTETKARRRRQRCVELRYQFSCYGLLFITSFQICICVYGCHNSSLFLILSLSFFKGLINTCNFKTQPQSLKDPTDHLGTPNLTKMSSNKNSKIASFEALMSAFASTRLVM
jgi:hypothetical protein